jgi:hypothetical protein
MLPLWSEFAKHSGKAAERTVSAADDKTRAERARELKELVKSQAEKCERLSEACERLERQSRVLIETSRGLRKPESDEGATGTGL